MTQLAEQEQIWGFLPDTALERVFANMEVTTLLRVLENTTNDHLKEIAVSNIVWKKRYEHLYYQEDVRFLLSHCLKRTFHDVHDEIEDIIHTGMGNVMTRPSYEAYIALSNYFTQGGQQTSKRPLAYYYINFLLIWSALPHAWSSDGGQTWSDFRYWVLVHTEHGREGLPRWGDDTIYAKWRDFKLMPRCTWFELDSPPVPQGKERDAQIILKRSDKSVCIELALYDHWIENGTDMERFRYKRKYGKCSGDIHGTLACIATRNALAPDARLSYAMDAYSWRLDYRLIPYLCIGKSKQDAKIEVQVMMDTTEKLASIYTIGSDGNNLLPPWIHNTNERPEQPDLMGCAVCATPSRLGCGNCRAVAYCSQACQRADFLGGIHSQICKRK